MRKAGTKHQLLERIPQSWKLVSKCAREYKEALKWNKIPPAKALMLERGLDFSLDSLSAISTQLKKNRFAQSEILTRSLFEIATNLLWASRAQKGWQRLQSEAANVDLGWANQAQSIRGLKQAATRILKSQQRQARAKEAARIPNVRDMLKQISKTDVKHKLVDPKKTGDPDYFYFMIYKLFSNTTHGHMVAIRRKPKYDRMQHITAAAVYAALMTIRAVYHTFNWDAEEPLKRFVPILRRERKKPVRKRTRR